MIESVNKNTLLASLKEDFKSAETFRRSQDEKRAKWKSEYNGEQYGNEVPNRSKLVSRDIKKQDEWQQPTLIEPFVSTPDIIKASPVSFEDADKAPKIELLLNTQFCRQFNRYNFMTKAIKLMCTEGTCITRTGWEYEEDTVEELITEEVTNPQLNKLQEIALKLLPKAEQGDEQAIASLEEIKQIIQNIPPTIEVQRKVMRTVPVKNQPTAIICKNEDIFIDPTCGDNFNDAQFVIHRYETTMSTLKQDGKYTNLDQIKIDDNETEDGFKFNGDREGNFKFKDEPRKKLIVYEYWGNYDLNGDGIAEPIVCSWVKDTIIRLENNPFPDKKPPFIVTPFNFVPNQLDGEPNAELISDIQKIKTAIYRGFIDNMALSTNGQKGLRKGALDKVNKIRFLNGENFEYNGSPQDFFEGHFNELPASIFNVLQLMNNEVESITGVASFNTGINGNSLGSTATSVRGALDSASSRRLNIVRNISENLVKPLLRKWLAYDAEFLDEEAQFRITNDEFVWLKREDLGARIDIDLTISTSDDNQAKASELAFLLQTIGPHEDPAVRKILMVEIARLYRMPDLAKRLEMYEPQPDPTQQRLMELQIAMLEAQVANENAKAGENEVDRELKGAKVQTELAKAKNLSSMADKIDLDYLQEFEGIKHSRDMERDKLNYQSNLLNNTLKLLANSKRQNL